MELPILASAWQPLLETAFGALEGASLLAEASVAPRLAAYLDLIAEWNRRTNLTGARSPEELVDLVVADAIVIARAELARAQSQEPRQATPLPTTWVDVGSGMGAPGLPLALLLPEIVMTLVEPRKQRLAFLRAAQSSLAISNAKVDGRRSQALPAQSCRIAVSRATFTPPLWLSEGARLATRGVWVLLAKDEPPRLSRWEQEVSLVYRWPLTGVARRTVRYRPRNGNV